MCSSDLNDDSISRMHARFLEIDNQIYLEDLNSTNGTYKNSIPLEIGETVKVSIGDEIRFADIIFNYY